MNTRSLLSILLISSAFLTSCKKELQPQDRSDAVAPAAGTAALAPTAQPQQVQQPQAQPGLNTVAATGTAAGMNPPHGQPNHRCDIAVGAPLNSAPAPTTTTAPATQVIQSSAKPTTIIPQTVKTTTVAAGMNPPHGQPNHRCDIAVGAPLNSPVANKTAAVAKIQPTANQQTTTFQPTTITASHTPPVMNPAHGQPGHSCAVAVGAPLPEKSE